MLRDLKRNYDAEKARLEGKAVSQARVIKQAKDIPGMLPDEPRSGAAEGIAGALVRMRDGATMQFHTDGSLRHAFGRRLAKDAKRRARKERRRAQRT